MTFHRPDKRFNDINGSPLFVVGPFPPPVHGASTITAKVAGLLSAAGHPVSCFNVSPPTGSRGPRHHFQRIISFAGCAMAILFRPSSATIYLSLSGGLGLIYDLVLVIAARISGRAVVFHHHSFAYLLRSGLLMRSIVGAAGARQAHVLLSNGMKSKFQQLYPRARDCVVVSNIAFFDVQKSETGHARSLFATVGYLSNVSLEKGIDRFLDFIAEIRAKGSSVKGLIAGPFDSEAVRAYVQGRIAEVGGIEYVGSVYDDKKMEFLSCIDLLVFPSRYRNEAEPLVVLESQMKGLPIAATDRGCIPEMLDGPSGILLDSDASDLQPLIRDVFDWEKDPAMFIAVSSAAVAKRQRLVETAKKDRERFLNIFS
jgi:glycosyltransferase involved in cell wall biosynthesis